MKKYPDERHADVIADLKVGLPVSLVAAFRNVPESTVRRWLHAHDLTYTPRRKTVSPALRTQILLVADGTSVSAAARHFNVSRRTIMRWRDKQNVVQRGETPRRWRHTCGTLVEGPTCPTCHYTAPWAQDAHNDKR